MGENHRGAVITDENVIRPYDRAAEAGGRVRDHQRQHLRFGGDEDQRGDRRVPRALPLGPDHPGVFEGRAIVFEGPEDYHDRIDDPALDIDEDCLLFIRNGGPKGYPGAAEVVNMRAPTTC